MYVRTYVRSSAQARTSRRSLRRRRRLDVYSRARIQYRLGACETRFISGRNVTRVCVHMHACVRVYVYACTHA